MKESDRQAKVKRVRRRVTQVSSGPGVYRWLDNEGRVLYVGKAKNLKSRMQQYVRPAGKHAPWTEIMIGQIADFDTTVTNTELEALLLETNLIKELRPKYNIMMKDDKNYVYVRISVQETFPRVDVVRRMEDDGALYFGPKTSAEQVRETLTFLRSLFPFRTCKMGIEAAGSDERMAESETEIDEKDSHHSPLTRPNGQGAGRATHYLSLKVVCTDRDRPTPCIDHHIKQCLAPCIGTVTPAEYRQQAIDGVIAFFSGKVQDAERILSERMQEAAKAKKFERAAKLRDQLKKLQDIQEKQIVSDTSMANTDTIGAALLSGHAYVVLLKERGGKLIGEESFSLQGTADNLSDVLGQFLPQYYLSTTDLPDTVVVGEDPADRSTIESWLSGLRGKRVRLSVPERGKKSKILLLAEKNADYKAKQTEAKWESEVRRTEESLVELQALLQLPAAPRRIEGYDISHLGGTAMVGSMVVFVGGKPKREHYRSFNIRSVKEGDIDDYRALAETLRRRLKYLSGGLKEELRQWKEKGVVIRKSRKADRSGITALIKANPEHLSSDDLAKGEFFVAVRGEAVIACCRLFAHKTGLKELRSVCVASEHRGASLGQSVIRALLAKQKRGKSYIVIDPELEEYYAEIGFRHTLTTPPVLAEKVKKILSDDPTLKPPAVMMFDPVQHKPDESFLSMPDLILVDGGKGQLSACVKVLKDLLFNMPIAGLAKREEEIFLPGALLSLTVAQDSSARFLLQRIRDEAHRFANAKRERRLESAMVRSALDDVPGIGEATKEALLKEFGSVDRVLSASEEELLSVLTGAQIESLRRVFPRPSA